MFFLNKSYVTETQIIFFVPCSRLEKMSEEKKTKQDIVLQPFFHKTVVEDLTPSHKTILEEKGHFVFTLSHMGNEEADYQTHPYFKRIQEYIMSNKIFQGWDCPETKNCFFHEWVNMIICYQFAHGPNAMVDPKTHMLCLSQAKSDHIRSLSLSSWRKADDDDHKCDDEEDFEDFEFLKEELNFRSSLVCLSLFRDDPGVVNRGQIVAEFLSDHLF
jgi:hypothetical protein